jgi:pyruvate,water dikinase
MSLLAPFSEISKQDSDRAGGKGASFGEMTQAGIPVSPGFVVLTEAFERFIAEADIIQEIESELNDVDQSQVYTVERASEADTEAHHRGRYRRSRP